MNDASPSTVILKPAENPNIRLLQLMDDPGEHPGDDRSITYAQMMTPAGLKAIAAYADAIGPSTRSIIPLTRDGRLAPVEAPTAA